MGMPAATITSPHICHKVNPGPVPHVGGPIVTGSGNVFIGGMPAARKGDKVVCVGPPDTINEGSSSVLINGKPAARMGDGTAHGGKIVAGVPTVLIGNGSYNYSGSDEDRIYGGDTLSCGGRDSTFSIVYKDPATVHKDNDASRKPVIKGGVVQPLEGTTGKPKVIPKSNEISREVIRHKNNMTFKIQKDENAMPEFTIFETYLEDKHINSCDQYAHFEAANKKLGTLLKENSQLREELGLTEKQYNHFTKEPPSKITPQGVTWHHHQDVGKIQLVDEQLHKRFGHVGGMEIWGGGRS